ncbi:receptor-type tyrosine-protein phosphatase T-like isoform X2 [Ostrea edulis]|uniref:receptor-type tyrosine-protein phosphatase T-like isoform X2 n=1 Tax=Ostrea edulis TaxID=37623 RepID=UPI0024AF2F04|nr:receptor-type tyrosine-protein phosphatase T-like isoform X2 [Ostrea edulis]
MAGQITALLFCLCELVFVTNVVFAYDNVALGKTAKQLNPYPNKPWGAERAVDGLKSKFTATGRQCTISNNYKQRAKWWVDLGGVLSIRHITIHYRTDNLAWDFNNGYTARFLGFSVYISNTTNKDDGVLCFKDTMYTNATIPNPTNITCPRHGRYVIYYNERLQNVTYPDGYSQYAKNELCEFEVYGCPKSDVYGENCDKPCSKNCQESHCNIVNGTCLGCIPGYKGSFCDQPCNDNKYDLECKQNCGNCSDGLQCNHVNGSCPNGCDAGAQGDRCDEECPGGFYGKNCATSCNPNCRGHCNRFNGRCESSCNLGWKGTSCEKECEGRFYGENCTQPCGQCRDLEQCHHINGTCLNGCDRGYEGGKCTEGCPESRYGYNCQERCNINCGDPERCDRVTGQCQNGCQAGWKNHKCDSKCDGNTFGLGCSQSCGVCLGNEQCHHVNGTCTEGCDRGYEGINCTQECDGKLYGENCTQPCGQCRDLEQCHHINGTCLNGCDRGYEGGNCTEECPSGRYGMNCDEKCKPNCRSCNRFNGTCESDCLSGWKGIFCEKECDGRLYGENCIQPCGQCWNLEQCHQINGTCLNGCNRGYQGGKCTEGCGWKSFGYNCNETCSMRCFNQTCDTVTGSCVQMDKQKQGSSDDSAPITVVIVFCILGLVVVVVVVIVFRRMRSTKTRTNPPPQERFPMETAENVYQNNDQDSQAFNHSSENLVSKDKVVSKPEMKSTKKHETKADYDIDDEGVENPYRDMYINQETLADVPVSRLERVITDKKKDEADGFKREYAILPYGEQHKCDAGKRPENVSKNRFKTTFPYDHSRVILKGDNGTSSDYINANYINGTDEQNEYIASQGPKQNTLVDFWAMIWQDNVSQIVMLTNLQEGIKLKCTQYWPEGMKAKTFGQFVVKSMEEKKYAFYVIRRFSVSHKQLKMARVVTQYHYTSWPDHGTPHPLCLIVFHDYVTRTNTSQTKAPTVVHCSAGIGRTGTYIALDALYKAGKVTGKVNVAEYVKTMRANRMNMVQTYEQYMTVFLALNDYFKAGVDTLSLDQFTQKTENLTGDQPANQTTIRKEFELLMKMRPVYSPADYKIAIQHVLNKKEYDVLPLDKYSLYLTSSIAKRGNFINAIHVPSYTDDRTFIVTNYPPPEGAVDFLRLLNDYKSNTVICMDPLREIESSKTWLPADPGSIKSLPPFAVRYESDTNTDVKTTTAQIAREEGIPHLITFVEPKGSEQSSGTPRDTSFLRSLVSFAQNLPTEYPITVVSKDGAMLCGVFCSVYNVIQQLKMDGSIDVFTAVRQLQTRRPEFCSTQDEYLLVYRAVCDYIEATSENVYYNQ